MTVVFPFLLKSRAISRPSAKPLSDEKILEFQQSSERAVCHALPFANHRTFLN